MDLGENGMSRGEIVGQNVKLELIRAHRGANEWLIVIVDRQPGGTIWALCSKFTSLSPSFSLTFTLRMLVFQCAARTGDCLRHKIQNDGKLTANDHFTCFI